MVCSLCTHIFPIRVSISALLFILPSMTLFNVVAGCLCAGAMCGTCRAVLHRDLRMGHTYGKLFNFCE